MTQTGEGYTPMVQQYMEIKKQHEDKLLFYRLGDFYELFFGDAITASRELNLTLTQRAGNTKHPIPMCGVPFHSHSRFHRLMPSFLSLEGEKRVTRFSDQDGTRRRFGRRGSNVRENVFVPGNHHDVGQRRGGHQPGG